MKNFQVRKWFVFLWEKMKKIFVERHFFVLSTNKAPNPADLILGWCRSWSFLSSCAQLLRLMNADVPDIYFTLLGAAVTTTVVLKHDFMAEHRGSWISFKSWILDAAMFIHTSWYCLWVWGQASILPVSKMRQILNSQHSYKKITIARRKYTRMEKFSTFKNWKIFYRIGKFWWTSRK